MGREQGLTDEKLTALSSYPDSNAFSDEERTVLRYADAMTDTPVEVSEELFGRLRGLYHERQIFELTSSLAWENYGRASPTHSISRRRTFLRAPTVLFRLPDNEESVLESHTLVPGSQL